MTKEEIKNEFDMTMGKANIKLATMCGEKLEDVVVTYVDGVIRSGTREILKINLDSLPSLKAAKGAVWSVVDALKPAKPADPVAKVDRPHGGKDLVASLDRMVKVANEKLADMTRGGFPFTFAEVKISTECDSAGIYVSSGATLVAAVARAGDAGHLVSVLKDRIFEVVDSTRAAIERRASLKADLEVLATEGEKRAKAAEALKAAGIDISILRGSEVNPEAAKAIVDAANKAVRAANRSPFVGVVPYREYKLSVKGFAGGVAIMCGGKPCMITRFPKVTNNKTIEKMVAFIDGDIKAMVASRQAYFERLRVEESIRDDLRRIAQRLDSAERGLKAAVM